MALNYQKFCQNLIKDLPKRTKDIIEQRFGLKGGERKTLEEIGKGYGITRERVRQIEEVGFLKLKPELENFQKIFQHFSAQVRTTGNLRKEDILLNLLGGSKFQNQVFFLLNLEEKFKRFSEDKDFYSLWTINPDSITLAEEALNFLSERLNKINRPLFFEEIFQDVNTNLESPLTSQTLISYLEISKKIQSDPEGRFGLKDWPEINPRGVKDKAYLIFKKENKPLHFREVTQLINSPEFKKIFQTKALPQTVHNELIKDPRFVLVGRGTYALREWGYQPGEVKDIISIVLKEAKKPLAKEEIIEKVLKQRLVKVSTILINLKNQKYFQPTIKGKYALA